VHQEREQASRAKDEVLAMLAHELRNPLAPISAAAELLTLMEPDRERVRKASDVIARQARHMTGLINDLLDVSRVTRGLIVLEQDILDLGKVVAEAVEQARPLIDARRHRLVVHVPDEPVVIQGDHKRLVQVVSNVLNNAAKYTRDGGNIALELAVQGNAAVITITDDGVGMSSDLVKRAFDLFAQAQRSSDRSQGGLGLGLALVKSLVELHRGTISARSAGLGCGSTFTIRLPRVVHALPPGPPGQPDTPPLPCGATGRRVMIVDDNIDAAHMLGKFLETLGHAVHVEHDAVTALAALAAGATAAPDVFLLDIGLPDIDGYELARRLRALPGSRSAILVAVTGYGGPQDRERTAAAGFDYHFVKPVDLGALSSLLAEAVSLP
jgi:CheY-like chemotaxis protein